MTAVLGVALKAACLSLLALAAVAALRRHSSSLRHCVLATALIGCLGLPFVALALPTWSVPVPSTWLGASAAVSQRWISEPITTWPEARMTTGGNPSPTRADLMMTLPFVTTVVWLVGSVVGIGVLAGGILRLQRIARHARPVDTGSWQTIADEVSRAYGLRRPVRLLRCSGETLTATYGTWRPTIFLPQSSVEWSAQRIEVVLRHELAHVQRRDWLVTMIASLARALYWFNPLLWITHRRLRDEAERACDDLVLRSGINGAEYATHLLGVARESMSHRQRWSPAIAIAHRSPLERRVRAMLDARLNREPLTVFATIAIVLALSSATLALGVVTITGQVSLAPSAATMQPISRATIATIPSRSVDVARTAPEVRAMPQQISAQQRGGGIEGVLYDQFGGLLPGAAVALTALSSGATQSTMTDRNGAFAFRSLPAGDYEMVTELPGFMIVRNVIRVEAGEAVRRHITLPIGSISETISVTCSTASSARPAAPTSTVSPGVPERRGRGSWRIEPKIPAVFTGGIGGQILAPAKLVDDWPQCPTDAPARATRVQLAGRIGIDGVLTDLHDVSEHADQAYVSSALEAVREWRFSPTQLNGAPIEVNISITVHYSADR